MAKVKVQGLYKDIRLAFPQLFSPQARSKAFADFARSELKAAQEHNRSALGRVPPHQTWVDGTLGGDLDRVKPDGTIVFEFEMVEELLLWIQEELFKNSPWLTGRYTRSHALFVDGKEASLDAPLPPIEQEAFFVNLQPYARRIERGWSDKAPDGVYESVAKIAKGRFANVADIKFSYRTPAFGAVHEWASRTRMQSTRRSDRAEWLRRQPAIVVTPRG